MLLSYENQSYMKLWHFIFTSRVHLLILNQHTVF